MLTDEFTTVDEVGPAIPAAANQQANWGLLLVVAAFAVGITMIGQLPYPIYDDWTYGWTVKHLIETGKLEYLTTFATGIPTLISAAFAAKIFGYSFSTLHSVSAFYNVLAACGLFFAIRQWTDDRVLASIAAATLLFNPILVNLSFALMTDPPTLAFMTWGFWAAARMLKNPRGIGMVIFFLTLLCLGMLNRQSCIIMVPMISLYGVSLLKHNKVTGLLLLVAIPVQFILLFGADNYLLNHVQFKEDSLRIKFAITAVLTHWVKNPHEFVLDAWFITGKVMAYVGAFAAPITVWKLPLILKHTYPKIINEATKFQRSASWWSLLIALLTVTTPLTYISNLCKLWMPYFPAFWSFPIVGSYCRFSDVPLGPEAMPQYWTFACNFLGTLFVWVTLHSVCDTIRFARITRNKPLLLFAGGLILCSAGLLFFSFIQGKSVNYDRYLIPLMVPLVLLNCLSQRIPQSSNEAPSIAAGSAHKFSVTLEQQRKGPVTAAIATTIVLAAYSLTAALDFVNFQNARWKAATHMEALGVPPDEIDAGPDFIFYKMPAIYGYNNPPTELFPFIKNPLNGTPPLSAVRGWPVLAEKYVVNPQIDPPALFWNYRPVYRQPYWSPWHWKEMQILVLKKISN